MPDQKKIILVDDEPVALRILAMKLERKGYHVQTAVNANDAMALAQEHQPQIMFLDGMMPIKDGFILCQELREHHKTKDTYIIMLTGLGSPADRDRALAAGANEWMAKPFPANKILERVEEIFVNLEEEN